MFLRRLLSAVTLVIISIPAFADNSLKLPGQAEWLVLDGKDAKELKIDKKAGVKLPDGKHQVVFQFNTLLQGSSDRTMYKSAPYLVTFNLAGNQQYQLKVDRDFRSTRDAEQFAAAPTRQLKLVDGNNKAVSYQLAVLKKKGMQFGRDLVEETRVFNLSSDPAAVYGLTGGAIASTATGAKLPVAPVANETAVLAENNLKYWYMTADPGTRERFIKWARQQQ